MSIKIKNYKAQITLIIIIGLLILISLIISINLISKKDPIKINNSSNINEEQYPNNVKNIIENCLENEAIWILKKIGDQGTLKPKNYISSKNIIISYLYYEGNIDVPGKKEIEDTISEKIKNNLENCLKNNDFYIENYNPEIKSVLNENELNIKVSFDKKKYGIINGKKVELDTYYINIKTNLLKILNKVKNYVTNINDEWLNIDELKDDNFNINIVKINTYIWIYEIIDNMGLNNEYYRYRFGIKYKE